MRRLPVFTPIVPLAVMLMLPAVLPAADPVHTDNETAAAAPLLGKWIVRSVQHEANPTAAQIGRKVGDIIKFARGADGNIGLT